VNGSAEAGLAGAGLAGADLARPRDAEEVQRPRRMNMDMDMDMDMGMDGHGHGECAPASLVEPSLGGALADSPSGGLRHAISRAATHVPPPRALSRLRAHVAAVHLRAFTRPAEDSFRAARLNNNTTRTRTSRIRPSPPPTLSATRTHVRAHAHVSLKFNFIKFTQLEYTLSGYTV
jgi:hypothetical protein